MTSPLRPLVLWLGLALALCAADGAQAQYSRPAQRVLSQARAATGGAGWNYLRGCHETGRQTTGEDAEGQAYERWLDPLRYGQRLETREPAGLRVHGFNGGGDWQILPGGAVTGTIEAHALAQARTNAFFAVSAFFYPGRFDARADYVGPRVSQGQPFDVVRVTPWGGVARELWFDRRTHRLARMIDRCGAQPVGVEGSD